jgi:hypothetical protein
MLGGIVFGCALASGAWADSLPAAVTACASMVVHLENGQTWEQAGPSSGGLELRQGDVVAIDRALGSWWFSGRQGDAIKVRRKE